MPFPTSREAPTKTRNNLSGRVCSLGCTGHSCT